MGLLDAPAAPRPFRPSIFGGLPIVASRGNGFSVNSGNLSNGTDTSANYRTMHVMATSATDLRVLVGNFYNGETNGPNPITVKVAAEVPLVGSVGNGGQVGAKVLFTWRGGQSVTLDPGCFALSDPLPALCMAGQILYLHTYVSVATAGLKWPLDLYTLNSNWEGATRGAPASDLSTGSGIAQSTEPAYSPIAILGAPVSGRPSSVALVGDSILYGSGDSVNSLGFAVRALNAAGIPYMQTAKPGEKATDRTGGGYLYPGHRLTITAGCTHGIEEYGRNDWANGRTLAQVQSDKLIIATAYAARGIKMWATTQIPGTSSTDSWATLVNQTVTANEAVRLALNAWIRAGLPIDPTTKAPVAAGSNGALLAGAAGHPYVGFFEIADTVESARNSGLWKVTGSANGYTADGTHPSATGHQAMAAGIDVSKLR